MNIREDQIPLGAPNTYSFYEGDGCIYVDSNLSVIDFFGRECVDIPVFSCSKQELNLLIKRLPLGNGILGIHGNNKYSIFLVKY